MCKTTKRFEDVELQASLDEDDSQTRTQLAEQLGVSQRAVSARLRKMGKIRKSGIWVPHELNDGQTKKRKNTRKCSFLLLRNGFLFNRSQS